MEVFFGAEQQHRAREPPIEQKRVLTKEAGKKFFILNSILLEWLYLVTKEVHPSADSLTTFCACKVKR